MIIGVFGLPGMGKSTFLAKCAYKSLHGKSFMGVPPHSKVFTNFECPGCYQLDFTALGVYHFSDSLFLIDEIMLLADSRDFKSFPPQLKYFFSHHRHFNCDVIWCSQYYDDCDKKIRVLTQKYYLLEKSSTFPVSFVKPITRFLGAKKGQMLDTYELGAPITWRLVWRPKYYGMFDSFVQKELPPADLVSWDEDSMNQITKEDKKAIRQSKKVARKAKREAKRQDRRNRRKVQRTSCRDWLGLIFPSSKDSE